MTSNVASAPQLSRRQFLKATGLAAGGLVVMFQLPACSDAGKGRASTAPEKNWAANNFVHIASNGQVTILVNHQEMGQGVYTALPMLLAEELDVDWAQISVTLAPVTPEYHHGLYKMRLTGGSTSISSSWQALRIAGARARAVLIQAAAQHWGVEANTLQTKNSQVIHSDSGRTVNYGRLVAAATALPVPEAVTLKDPKDFSVIGTNVKRIEGADKVTGKARFSLDVKRPGMLTAAVVRPPVYGNSVKTYQADKALAYPGVVKVKQISTGVAVIARDFWAAKKASELLVVEWDEGPAANFSTTKQQQYYRELAEQPGPVAENIGQVDKALNASEQTLEGVYEVPYLAHACMEPLSCTAQVTDHGCELWLGTQAQTFDQNLIAELLDIKPEQVRVNGQLMGGGFGRRVSRQSDYVGDAVEVAKNETVPIKTIWTRENDIQGGYYRPLFTQKVTAGLDHQGLPIVWWQRLVGQSISINSPFESSIKNGIDYSNLGGAAWRPYAIANRRTELHGPAVPIPVHWWRGICYTQNTFVAESFMDEIAYAGKQDPLALRQRLLVNHPRHLQVLALAAEKFGWGNPLPEGHGQGLAVENSQGSYVAQIAEVSVGADNKINVHRVVCAIDCGIAVNPMTIKAQLEGSIIFGLSAALYGEITIEKGSVQQSNFHDYPVLRMDALPDIEVHIVNSGEAPSGTGEPGVPPIAPAVANAIFTATGKRVRRLPIRL